MTSDALMFRAFSRIAERGVKAFVPVAAIFERAALVQWVVLRVALVTCAVNVYLCVIRLFLVDLSVELWLNQVFNVDNFFGNMSTVMTDVVLEIGGITVSPDQGGSEEMAFLIIVGHINPKDPGLSGARWGDLQAFPVNCGAVATRYGASRFGTI
jgi:hypothetical protein